MEFIGWVDTAKSKVLVPAESVKCMIKREDGTYFINANGNKDEGFTDIQVFKCLQDAHAWLTL
eukprot:m.356241 g.356241  ORF g.356241 m.356241 type:complete len:63 (+) comp17482_c0_seq1:239-427(+)